MGLLGGLGGIIGGIAGANKEKSFTSGAMGAQASAIAGMLGFQKAGMQFSQEEYEKALGELESVGPAMRTELLAREKAGLGAETANALGTGLTGTTALSGRLRGARADTQRNLAGLEEGLAGARSSLHAARSSQIYQQYIDRANIRQRTKFDPFLENFQFGQIGAAGAAGGAGIGGFLEGIFDFI